MTGKPKLQVSSCMGCAQKSDRFFCQLSSTALREFDMLGTQVAVAKGAVIFHESDPAKEISVICSGQVKLSCSSPEGRTLIVKIAMRGDVLGLGAVVLASAHEVTAEALGPVVLKSIRQQEFMGFLAKHGEASISAARALSEDYKSAFLDARRLALAPSAAGRLASVLLEWAHKACPREGEQRFAMNLKHEELANLAGTSRETVTRMLSRFQREGLIEVQGSYMKILAVEGLAKLASLDRPA